MDNRLLKSASDVLFSLSQWNLKEVAQEDPIIPWLSGKTMLMQLSLMERGDWVHLDNPTPQNSSPAPDNNI